MAMTINIFYSGAPGKARQFAEEMISRGIVQAIREEKGNLRYEYFFPLEDASTLLLIDSWEDQAALDRHHQSPMMQSIIELREKYDLHMRVERYVSAENPHADQTFIRE